MMVIPLGTALAKPVATLNFFDTATINDTVIHLEDIASVSTEFPELAQKLRAAIAGEIAPPGYSRFISTEDLIAYRLQPAFSDVTIQAVENKRIVVKTTGITRKVGEYSNAVQEYLDTNFGWKTGEWSFEIENSEETFKTLDLPQAVSVERPAIKTESSFPRGHVQLQLIVKQYERILRIPITCLLKISAPVATARHAIIKGKLIDSSDIELTRIDISNFGPDPYFCLQDIIGQKSLRSIGQGTILYNRLLSPIPVVSKGDQLDIKVMHGNVMISVLAIARENGNLGQKIWVENATTHKLVHVLIKDKNTAVVL